MKILLTAFDPFGGESINPALEAVKLLAPPQGVTVQKLEVPTAFAAGPETVIRAMRAERPDAVVCVGQAGGRAGVSVERLAVNLCDARIPDNAGEQPVDLPVVPDGPAAYFSTLPVKTLVQAIRDAGVEASVSNTAGTFVCNALLYRVLDLAAREMPGVRAVFLHVPFLPEQTRGRGVPSMPLPEMVRALEAALEAVKENLIGEEK